MLRALIVCLVVLMVFEALRPALARLGFRNLPGDLRFRLRGRVIHVPLGTALLLTLLGWTVSHWF